MAGNARSVVKALAAKLTARQLDRLLREHDRRADANAAFGIEQTGVNRHLVDGDGLVLLTCLEQMRRHAGYHAVQRFVRENGHLTAEQHARVYTADRREPQKAAVPHLGNKKANLVEMRVQQDGFRALFTAGQAPITLPFLSASTVSQYGRNSSATAFAACISKPLTAGSAHSVRSVCSNCKEIPPFSSFIVHDLLYPFLFPVTR